MSIRKADGSEFSQPTQPKANDIHKKVEKKLSSPDLSAASKASSPSSKKTKADAPPSVLHAVVSRSSSYLGKSEKITPPPISSNFFKTHDTTLINPLYNIANNGKLTKSENRNQKEIADNIRKLSYKAAEFLNANPLSEERESIEAVLKWVHFDVAPLLNEPVWNRTNSMPKLVHNILLEANSNDFIEKPRLLAKSDEQKLYRKIKKAELSISLGGGITKNKGATGTVIITDINGKNLGIHKVSRKDVSLRTRINNAFKEYFGGQLYYLPKKPMSQPQSERATYLLDKKLLGFNIAPPTQQATFNGKKGYFQKFVREPGHNYTEAKANNAFKNKPVDQFTNSAANTKFQEFAVLDFLIGNLDRHDDNWFISLDEENNIRDIKAIDNANSFPEKHPPAGSAGARNQYKWKEFNISEVAFTPEFKASIMEKLSDEKILDILFEIDADMPGFLTPQSKELFVQRAYVIKEVLQRENSTPKNLTEFVDFKSISKIVKNNTYFNDEESPHILTNDLLNQINDLKIIAIRGKLTRNDKKKQDEIVKKIQFINKTASLVIATESNFERLGNLPEVIKWINLDVVPLLDVPVWDETNKMPKNIQNLLKPELGAARGLAKENHLLKSDNNEKLKRKIMKAELAQSMGIGTVKNKGATGTVIITDVNGKRLGVHKVSSKEVNIRVRINNAIKQLFGGQLYYLPQKPMSQPQSERATYLLDKHLLGFDMAPATREATFNGKKGYFQQYVRAKNVNYVEAKERGDFKVIPADHITPKESELFERFAILDFLIGNLDRHDENWFLGYNDKNELVDIKAIDNANAFPEKHPLIGSLAARNQYKWKEYKISQVPFSTAFREEIIKKLSPENLRATLEKIDYDMPEFLSQNSGDLLIQRAQVILALMEMPNTSPHTLTEYADDPSMQKLLSPNEEDKKALEDAEF